MECPECKGRLNGAGNSYTCAECGLNWQVDFACDVCHETPEMDSHCGSVSFFCKSCKKLKSRETMEKTFTRKA
jgi:hypothetical protein